MGWGLYGASLGPLGETHNSLCNSLCELPHFALRANRAPPKALKSFRGEAGAATPSCPATVPCKSRKYPSAVRCGPTLIELASTSTGPTSFSVGIGPNSADARPSAANIGGVPPKPGRSQPNSRQPGRIDIGPKWARFRTNLADVGRACPKLGHNQSAPGPHRATSAC